MTVKQFEVKNLIAIRIGVDRHNARCPVPPEVILMNPIDCELMNHPRLWEYPCCLIQRFQRSGSAFNAKAPLRNIEGELELYLDES